MDAPEFCVRVCTLGIELQEWTYQSVADTILIIDSKLTGETPLPPASDYIHTVYYTLLRLEVYAPITSIPLDMYDSDMNQDGLER